MEHYKKNIKYLAVVAVFFVMLISSCQKEDELGQADRLFRPIVTKTTYGGTWIRVEWDKYSNVKTYHLQLSTDTFKTIISDVDTDTTFYKFENLEYDTNYFIQIKSIGAELESRYLQSKAIRTPDFPTKLNSITSNNVIDTQVKVSWLDASYDSLVVLNAGTRVKSIIVTDENNADKVVIIKSLMPATSYIVKSYQGGNYQGKKSFATLASQVFVGDVVDLRNFTDAESYLMLNQAYFDQLKIDHPNGVTVILSGGTHYELSGTILVKSAFNLVTGYSFSGKAIFEVNGNFNLEAGTVIGNVHFEKLKFTDHPSCLRTTANYGGKYIFNINGSGSVLDNVSFEDCDIRYKRGIVRVQTAATLNSVSINNCFMDSIGGYGVVNLDNAGVITKSISVSNSTVAHTDLFLRGEKMTLELENFKVTNVTTYSTPVSYFFQFGNITKAEISNCLFGAVKNTTTGAQGFITKGITTSTIQNNFRTGDCKWVALTDAGGAVIGDKNPIESTQLSGTSADIFGDVNANNYTVADPKLKGKIGDPRWW